MERDLRERRGSDGASVLHRRHASAEGGALVRFTFTNMRCVPSFKYTLLSVTQLWQEQNVDARFRDLNRLEMPDSSGGFSIPCTAAQIQAARRIGGSSTVPVYDVWQSIYGFRRPICPSALAAMPCACACELTVAWRYGEPLASSAASLVRHYARAPDFGIRGNPARSTEVEEYSDAAALLMWWQGRHTGSCVSSEAPTSQFSLLLAAADLLRTDALCTVGFASGGAFVYMVGMHDQRTFMRELVSF